MFPKVSDFEWVIPSWCCLRRDLRGVTLLEEVLSLGSGFEAKDYCHFKFILFLTCEICLLS